MDGIGPIFKTSAISLSPHSPPDAMWNDFLPSLLTLLPHILIQQLSEHILTHLYVWETPKLLITQLSEKDIRCAAQLKSLAFKHFGSSRLPQFYP